MHSLPVFVRLKGRPVILVGNGPAADAKRWLLERAGAQVVDEDGDSRLAIVVDDDAAVARLRARGVLVNAVDRPELCDFTLPAIVDRSPVLIAIGTGGASAGLAAALRQQLEAIMPASLGALADALHAARDQVRRRWPDVEARRRAIGAAFDGPLDPLREAAPDAVEQWLNDHDDVSGGIERVAITSPDPDELTLRAARLLAQADRIYHGPGICPAILARARADAPRTLGPPPDRLETGLTVVLEAAP